MTEDQLQAACYQWAVNTYPEIRKLFFAVPNGGSRNKVEAMKFKATGLVPGIPDLVLVRLTLPAIGFELKTETGKLSPDQIECSKKWPAIYVIRTLEHFQGLFTQIIRNGL